MSTALEIARAFETAWQGGDGKAAAGYLADDCVLATFGGETVGAETIVQRLAGFMEIVNGPVREVAAVGGDQVALVMSEIPTSQFGLLRSAAHYVVTDGRIVSQILVHDTGTPGPKAQEQPSDL